MPYSSNASDTPHRLPSERVLPRFLKKYEGSTYILGKFLDFLPFRLGYAGYEFEGSGSSLDCNLECERARDTGYDSRQTGRRLLSQTSIVKFPL